MNMFAMHFFAGFPCEVYSDQRGPAIIVGLLFIASIVLYWALAKRRPKAAKVARWAVIILPLLFILNVIIYLGPGCNGRVILWQ